MEKNTFSSIDNELRELYATCHMTDDGKLKLMQIIENFSDLRKKFSDIIDSISKI